MTTIKVKDFLTKELFINHNVVTFRSLSRELGIHVNDAKHELQVYYESTQDTDSPSVPTYLINGEVPSCYKYNEHENEYADEYDMQLDMGLDDEEDEPDVVLDNKTVLVDATNLAETMAQFTRVLSVHVYCLSPARLKDAGIICPAGTSVQNAEMKGGTDMFPIVGKITGPHVRMKAASGLHTTVASSSTKTLDPPSKGVPKAPAPVVKSEQPVVKGKTNVSESKQEGSAKNSSVKVEPKARSKASGKLDWSKAKSKDKAPVTEAPKETAKVKVEPKMASIKIESTHGKQASSASKATATPVLRSNAHGQRGVKRKSRSLSDSEDESWVPFPKNEPVTTSRTSSVKKGVIVSDEDDDDEIRIPGRRRRNGKTSIPSNAEMSLRAMMDIDDDQVDRASRRRSICIESDEEEESEALVVDEGVAPPLTSEGEDLDDEPVVQPKKRKPRKIVPVGRNGLKKKRVVKSKTSTDAKGYIQTVDYSSYESVEEEDVEVNPPARRKGKKDTEPVLEVTGVKKESKEDAPVKTKPRVSSKPRGGAAKRGGLLNFFGPDKAKK